MTIEHTMSAMRAIVTADTTGRSSLLNSGRAALE